MFFLFPILVVILLLIVAIFIGIVIGRQDLVIVKRDRTTR